MNKDTIKIVREHRPDLVDVSDNEIIDGLEKLFEVVTEIFTEHLTEYSFMGNHITSNEIQPHIKEVKAIAVRGVLNGREFQGWTVPQINKLTDEIEEKFRFQVSRNLFEIVKKTTPTEQLLLKVNDLKFDSLTMKRQLKNDKEAIHLYNDIEQVYNYLTDRFKYDKPIKPTKDKPTPKQKEVIKTFADAIIDDSHKDKLFEILREVKQKNQTLFTPKTDFTVKRGYSTHLFSIIKRLQVDQFFKNENLSDTLLFNLVKIRFKSINTYNSWKNVKPFLGKLT